MEPGDDGTTAKIYFDMRLDLRGVNWSLSKIMP